jgi:hypothetical protein
MFSVPVSHSLCPCCEDANCPVSSLRSHLPTYPLSGCPLPHCLKLRLDKRPTTASNSAAAKHILGVIRYDVQTDLVQTYLDMVRGLSFKALTRQEIEEILRGFFPEDFPHELIVDEMTALIFSEDSMEILPLLQRHQINCDASRLLIAGYFHLLSLLNAVISRPYALSESSRQGMSKNQCRTKMEVLMNDLVENLSVMITTEEISHLVTTYTMDIVTKALEGLTLEPEAAAMLADYQQLSFGSCFLLDHPDSNFEQRIMANYETIVRNNGMLRMPQAVGNQSQTETLVCEDGSRLVVCFERGAVCSLAQLRKCLEQCGPADHVLLLNQFGANFPFPIDGTHQELLALLADDRFDCITGCFFLFH